MKNGDLVHTEESWKLSHIIHFVIIMGTGDITLNTRENDTKIVASISIREHSF